MLSVVMCVWQSMKPGQDELALDVDDLRALRDLDRSGRTYGLDLRALDEDDDVGGGRRPRSVDESGPDEGRQGLLGLYRLFRGEGESRQGEGEDNGDEGRAVLPDQFHGNLLGGAGDAPAA